MGGSFIHARSNKQKLTATSSTDAEIIAASSSLTQMIWLQNLQREILHHILQAPISPGILYQDNKSAIWMVTQPSRYKRSKHILTKVSYIKHHRTMQDIELKYLSTDEMTADVLTKPLQGAVFKNHCDKMMGKVSST
jgi:hypothetical protein